MAPETLSETTTPIDGRADQWAMAVIAYRMLSGKLPWDEGNADELLRQIVNDPPRPLPRTASCPLIPWPRSRAGMSKRREDRYETMVDFVRALTARTASAAHVETVAARQRFRRMRCPRHARPAIGSGRGSDAADSFWGDTDATAAAAAGPCRQCAAPSPAVVPAVPAVPVLPVAPKPAAAAPTPSAPAAPAPPAPSARPASGPPPVLAAPPFDSRGHGGCRA